MAIFQSTAKAQSVLTDTLALPSTGSSFVSEGLSPFLGTVSAQGHATISSAVIALGDYSSADTAALLAHSTLLIGAGALTFSSYDETSQRASFTGSVTVSNGIQYRVVLNCICDGGRFVITYADGTATGWPFSLEGSTTYQLQLSGALNTPPTNAPPHLQPIAHRADLEGYPISFLPIASHAPSGDRLSWSAQNLPPGFDIDGQSGEISGAGTSPGTYESLVTVSDTQGAASQQQFNWTIRANVEPMISAIGNQTTPTFSSVSLSIAASDADGDAISFSATGLPDGLSLDAATGIISGTPSSIGVYQVTLSASDIYDAQDMVSFTWTITEAPFPAGNSDTAAATAQPFSRRAPLNEASVRRMLTATRLHLATNQRLAVSSGTDRLKTLRHRAYRAGRNRSQNKISIRFLDETAQKIADSGLTQGLNKAASKGLDRLLPHNTAIWSSGQLAVGSLKNIGGGKLKIRARDVALGLDQYINDSLTLSGYVQSSNSQDDRSTYDNKLSLSSFFGYASYVPNKNRFAQFIIGRGKLNIDLNRATQDTLYGGTSSGRQSHALLAFGQHFNSPIGKLTTAFDVELHEATLAAYEELGEDGAYGYRAQKISSQHAGLSGTWQKSWHTQSGKMNAHIGVGYQDTIGDAETAYAFALHDTGTLYYFDPTASNASMTLKSLEMGLAFKNTLGWQFDAQFGWDNTQAGTIRRLRLAARWQF